MTDEWIALSERTKPRVFVQRWTDGGMVFSTSKSYKGAFFNLPPDGVRKLRECLDFKPVELDETVIQRLKDLALNAMLTDDRFLSRVYCELILELLGTDMEKTKRIKEKRWPKKTSTEDTKNEPRRRTGKNTR